MTSSTVAAAVSVEVAALPPVAACASAAASLPSAVAQEASSIKAL